MTDTQTQHTEARHTEPDIEQDLLRGALAYIVRQIEDEFPESELEQGGNNSFLGDLRDRAKDALRQPYREPISTASIKGDPGEVIPRAIEAIESAIREYEQAFIDMCGSAAPAERTAVAKHLRAALSDLKGGSA